MRIEGYAGRSSTPSAEPRAPSSARAGRRRRPQPAVGELAALEPEDVDLRPLGQPARWLEIAASLGVDQLGPRLCLRDGLSVRTHAVQVAPTVELAPMLRVLVELDDSDPRLAQLMYIGATRARQHLVVIGG